MRARLMAVLLVSATLAAPAALGQDADLNGGAAFTIHNGRVGVDGRSGSEVVVPRHRTEPRREGRRYNRDRYGRDDRYNQVYDNPYCGPGSYMGGRYCQSRAQ